MARQDHEDGPPFDKVLNGTPQLSSKLLISMKLLSLVVLWCVRRQSKFDIKYMTIWKKRVKERTLCDFFSIYCFMANHEKKWYCWFSCAIAKFSREMFLHTYIVPYTLGTTLHAIVQLHIDNISIPCQVWLKKSIHIHCKVFSENYHV